MNTVRLALLVGLAATAPLSAAGRVANACVGANRAAIGTVTLRLHLVNQAGLVRDTRHELMKESARIWRASGVTVHWVDDPSGPAGLGMAEDASENDRPGGVDIYVTAVPELPAPDAVADQRPLAAILFMDGKPTTAITAFPVAVERLLENARSNDRPLSELPSKARNQLFGRVLGRAVAHELGHYLFKSPNHTEKGLMRATQRADELISFFDWPFRVLPPRVAACDAVAALPTRPDRNATVNR